MVAGEREESRSFSLVSQHTAIDDCRGKRKLNPASVEVANHGADSDGIVMRRS